MRRSQSAEGSVGNGLFAGDIAPATDWNCRRWWPHGNPEQFRSQMRTHLMVYFKKLSTE